jgi:hypothetical protein
LSVIRSLAYFSPVIDEVLSLRVDDTYFRHLRQRLARILQQPTWLCPHSRLRRG